MSKMKQALERRTEITRINVHYENEEVLNGGLRALPRTVAYERRPITTQQRATMVMHLLDAARAKTGYDHIPIERLREMPAVHKLLDMLETCRPGGSQDEEDFIKRFIGPHSPHEDGYGNQIVIVPIPEGHPQILWSTHTDTVHRHRGTQKVEVSAGMAWTSDGSCLGSDDTVGVWLALEMIEAKVPGVYVFHREEESGGGGSMFLADKHEDWLGRFDCAIALDRAGYSDVITYQGGQRCCSDRFAKTLAALLGGSFKPCETGVFTDTANYVDAIGECTNLSVGYFKQHGPMEHTNLSFAVSLRDKLVTADWSKLEFERKPGEVEEVYAYYERDRPYGSKPVAGSWAAKIEDMEEFIRAYPWVVAEYLVECGVSTDDLETFEPGDYDDRGV